MESKRQKFVSEDRRQAILVLGMHRSGTSALGELVYEMGAKAPMTPLKATKDNVRGYWESKPLMLAHDKFLQKQGTSWNDSAIFDLEKCDHEDVETFKAELQKIILTEYGSANTILIKDPRICRFVPVWRELLGSMGIEILPIIIFRNPLEVAYSLIVRDDFTQSGALLSWLRHVLEAERNTRDLPRLFVDYADLLSAPDVIMQTISKFEDTHGASCLHSSYTGHVINSSLKHQSISFDDFSSRDDIPELVKRTYSALREFTALDGRSVPGEGAYDALNQCYDDLNQMESLYRPILAEQSNQLSESEDTFETYKTDLNATLESQKKLAEKQSKAIHVKYEKQKEKVGTLRSAHAKLRFELENQIELFEDFRQNHKKEVSKLKLKLSAETEKLNEEEKSKLNAQQEISQITMTSETYKGRAIRAFDLLDQLEFKHSIFDKFKNKFYEKEIIKLGLFDRKYYEKQAHEMGIEVSGDLLKHFLRKGHLLGVNPHPLFDVNWYRDQNEDVQKSGINPLIHYIRSGSKENRDPHPVFSNTHYAGKISENNRDAHLMPMLSHFLQFGKKMRYDPHPKFDIGWYLDQNPDVSRTDINPLIHYLLHGNKEARSPHSSIDEKWYKKRHVSKIPDNMSALEFHNRVGGWKGYPTFPGQNKEFRKRSISDEFLKTIVVVAHSVSDQIFGAERSLIDVLQGIDPDKYRVVLAAPSENESYNEKVWAYIDKFVVYKNEWWEADKKPSEANMAFFEKLYEEELVALVYVNTIMLPTPSLVARQMNIPVITHIRELIDRDKNLLAHISLTSEQIISAVSERSDVLIANSEDTEDLYRSSGKCVLVPNAIDVPKKSTSNKILEDGILRVGMLSSNIEKKGIDDLCALAILAEQKSLPVEFVAFGPETEEVRRIKENIRLNKGPHNIAFPGYVSDPKDAIAAVNIVVNFSRFAESFGRTVVEAMAACRPVICFEHGALPTVIEDKKTGFLIPYLKPEKAISYLKYFIENPSKLDSMGRAGHRHVLRKYSHEVLWKNTDAAFYTALNAKKSEISDVFDAKVLKNAERPLETRTLVSVVIPNYNYSHYLEERIQSILDQTHRPDEIIFLDDCSSDDSLTVARKILGRQKSSVTAIPFRIIPSNTNAGVYKQWLKGIREAKNDWVWIAEADDTSDPYFLETLAGKISSEINLIYCQSRKIDESGEEISPNNFAHTNDISTSRWKSDYIENGAQEVVTSLAFRNSIPNTSSAIFRKSATKKITSSLTNYRFCGDWFFYAFLLKSGGVAYSSQPLNNFRRHDGGVTRQQSKTAEYLIELARIREYLVREFPILPRQFERMDWFLNRDYKITNIKTNSKYSKATPFLKKAIAHAAKRKRFGIITTNNGSYNGGSEMLWQESALALRNQGHDVVVLIKAWDPVPPIIEKLKFSGVRVLFKEDNGFDAFVESMPDFVLVSIGDQDEGTEYYDELAQFDIPYAIVNQLTKEERYWRIRENKTAAVTKGYTDAKAVFFTCKNNHKVMEARIRTKISNARVHYNPYHIDRAYVPPFPSTRNGYNIAIPSKLLFIHKGQDLIVEMLKDPKWSSREVHFNFYGAGPDFDTLQNLIDKNNLHMCTIRGRVEDIGDIWKSNHALLMPSKMEGLPIMIVSAMLSARVCIATDIGGHAEVVDDNKSGFIIPNPTVEDLSECLEAAFGRRREWEKIGQMAREDILEYLPEDPVENFLEQLHQVMT